MTWFPTGPAVTLYDRDSYEAFPAAHTHPVTGTTIATWASGGTHYTTAADIRRALDGMRIDLDNGRLWFDRHASRRERAAGLAVRTA